MLLVLLVHPEEDVHRHRLHDGDKVLDVLVRHPQLDGDEGGPLLVVPLLVDAVHVGVGQLADEGVEALRGVRGVGRVEVALDGEEELL